MLVKWTDKSDDIVTELPDNCFGFVYRIRYKDGTTYYGKKQVTHQVTLQMKQDGTRRPNSTVIQKRVKLTADELDGRSSSDKRTSKLVKFERINKISNAWLKYTGSSELTPDDSKIKRRQILYYSSNKMTLTYLEVYVLFINHAAANKNCHNKNINRMWYDNSLDGLIKWG